MTQTQPIPSSFRRQPTPSTTAIALAADQNRLLAGWPEAVRRPLLTEAELVPLQAKTVLFEAGAPLSHAVFPTTSLLVGLHRTKTGASVVAGHVDYDGVFGSLTAFNKRVTAWMEITVLLGGDAVLVPVELLREAMAESPLVNRDIVVWGQHMLQVAMQNVICSRSHSVPERTACWLLLLHDRLDGRDEIPVTHDLLSQTLDVHRPSITLGLKELTAVGALGPGGRGWIWLRDRARLESAACECYEALAAASHLNLS